MGTCHKISIGEVRKSPCGIEIKDFSCRNQPNATKMDANTAHGSTASSSLRVGCVTRSPHAQKTTTCQYLSVSRSSQSFNISATPRLLFVCWSISLSTFPRTHSRNRVMRPWSSSKPTRLGKDTIRVVSNDMCASGYEVIEGSLRDAHAAGEIDYYRLPRKLEAFFPPDGLSRRRRSSRLGYLDSSP